MPCFCLEPYQNMNLVGFRCGHVVHQVCARKNNAVRRPNHLRPSCPICNRVGRYQIFQDLVNRHRILLPAQNIAEPTANQSSQLNQDQNSDPNPEPNPNHQANDHANDHPNDNINESDESDREYEIPRMGIGLTVRENSLVLTTIPTEIVSDSDSGDDHPDIFNVGPINMNMRVDARSILFYHTH